MAQIFLHQFPHPTDVSPVAREIVLPFELSEFGLNGFTEQASVSNMVTCDVIAKAWENRRKSARYPLTRKVYELLGDLSPHSIIDWQSETFLGFRRTNDVPAAEECCHAQILMQFTRPMPDYIGDFPILEFPEYREFLDHFRNLDHEIPPINTCWRKDGEQVEYLDITKYYDGPHYSDRLGDWKDAIPLMYNQYGDVFLLSRHGKIGKHDHEMVSYTKYPLMTELTDEKFAKEFLRIK